MKSFETFMNEAAPKIDKYEQGDTSLIIPVERLSEVTTKLGNEFWLTYGAMSKATKHDPAVHAVVKKGGDAVMYAMTKMSDEIDKFLKNLSDAIDP